MNKHYFKINLDRSDLFILEINDTQITYEVRDKESGKLLEPKRTSFYEVLGNQVHFDMRFVPHNTFIHIRRTLTDFL